MSIDTGIAHGAGAYGAHSLNRQIVTSNTNR